VGSTHPKDGRTESKELSMKHKKPIPKEAIDGTLFEWKDEDVYVPPREDFSGCHIKMLVPYFKPRPRNMFKSQRAFRMWSTKYAGSRAGFWHSSKRKNHTDVRWRVEISLFISGRVDRKMYFNSNLLAVKYFKDDPNIVYKDGFYHLEKLVDHEKNYLVDGFNIKIDSLDNLRLASHGENGVNRSVPYPNSTGEKYIQPQLHKGEIRGFQVNLQPIKMYKYFSLLEYGTEEQAFEAAKVFRDSLPFTKFHKIKK